MSTTIEYMLEAGILAASVLALYFALTTTTLTCLATAIALWTVYSLEKWRTAPTPVTLSGRYVLITGCDSGFGLCLAKHLRALDCHVIATVLQPESQGAKELRGMGPSGMTVLQLDVSCDDSVATCLKAVQLLCKGTGLWGLVNNAGINFMGEVELTTMAQYLHIANVNIFGMVRCTRAFLPLLRKAKGRLINVTSTKGRLPNPWNAAYGITKYGGETFSDIVRLEMQQFGVKVVIIEPGNFGGTTGCLNTEGMKRIRKDFDEMWAAASDDVKQVFSRRHLDKVLEQAQTAATTACPTLSPVIEAMTHALTANDPKIRYLVGGSNSFVDIPNVLAKLKPFIPERIFDRVLLYYFPCSVYME